MAAMASSLLKASSYYNNNYTNQTINRRIIINPPPTTRISFPINQKIIPITQNPLPKITTATTTKCSSNSIGSTFREEEEDTKCSSNSSRGSTISEDEEKVFPILFERLKERIVKKMLKAVKGLEKPALTAILVWVLLTNNPTIASSYSSRTAFFWGVWFVYDVCKAIATTRRIGDGRIRFYMGHVLGSTVLLLSGSIGLLMAVFIAVVIGIVLFFCGLVALLLLLTVAFIGMVSGFGKVTYVWPPPRELW